MSAAAEASVTSTLFRAKGCRLELEGATTRERNATIEYMDAARAAGWGWGRVGRELDISATGARRYYERNRRRVRGV